MTRTPPPSDWVVYAVVLGTVAAMMLGKFLIARGNKEDIYAANNKKQEVDKTDDKS